MPEIDYNDNPMIYRVGITSDRKVEVDAIELDMALGLLTSDDQTPAQSVRNAAAAVRDVGRPIGDFALDDCTDAQLAGVWWRVSEAMKALGKGRALSPNSPHGMAARSPGLSEMAGERVADSQRRR